MGWLAHVLAADACRAGGTVLSDHPASAPLATIRKDVETLGPSARWSVHGLAAGGACALRAPAIADAGLAQSRPDLPVIAVDSPGTRDVITRLHRPPDLLLSDAACMDHAPVSPHAPGLLVRPDATALSDRLAGVADAIHSGRAHVADVLAEAWGPQHAVRVHADTDGTVQLNFEPLRWLRCLDGEAAMGLALAGDLPLARGEHRQLRIPTLGGASLDACLHFVGRMPFSPPTVAVAGGAASLHLQSETSGNGVAVHLRGPVAKPWVDVHLWGARLALVGLELRLPGLGSTPVCDDWDPLSAYAGDPLAAYGPGDER